MEKVGSPDLITVLSTLNIITSRVSPDMEFQYISISWASSPVQTRPSCPLRALHIFPQALAPLHRRCPLHDPREHQILLPRLPASAHARCMLCQEDTSWQPEHNSVYIDWVSASARIIAAFSKNSGAARFWLLTVMIGVPSTNLEQEKQSALKCYA